MRKSLRLPHFDYSTPGAYAITVVARDRAALFGAMDVASDTVVLNAAGEMVRAVWNAIPQHDRCVTLDAVIVMPDHVHGIVILTRTANTSTSLINVVHWFKTITTTRYLQGVRDDGWQRFRRKVWQRSFFDHVVRDERDLDRIRGYIERNPGALWEKVFSQAPGAAGAATSGRPYERPKDL